MAQHFATEHNTFSICSVTGDTDVFSYGADDGPTTYCESCREGEPEWTFITDEEYRQMTA